MWGEIAQLGLKFLGGVRQARAANNQALQQETLGLQDEQAAWANNLADNQSIQEANLQNTVRTGYRQGILNMQRGFAKQQAAEAGFQLGRNRQTVLSAATANAAAAGTVGQSVDAVVNDVDQKADEVQGRQESNFIQTEANFDSQVHDLIQQGQDALLDPTKARVRETARANRIGVGSVLVDTALQVGSQYMQSNMSLGMQGSTSSNIGSSFNWDKFASSVQGK